MGFIAPRGSWRASDPVSESSMRWSTSSARLCQGNWRRSSGSGKNGVDHNRFHSAAFSREQSMPIGRGLPRKWIP
jgi:hypothetical protein